MNIEKYFWDLNESALKETSGILKNPVHPRFAARMVTLLSRCDRPKELFSLISREEFVEAWPKVRAYWIKIARHSDFRDWWESIYESLIEKQRGRSRKVKGTYPIVFQSIGRIVKEMRVKKGLSQKQLAQYVGMKQPDISSIEEGKKNITLYTLFRLCKVLGIKRIELVPQKPLAGFQGYLKKMDVTDVRDHGERL